MNNCSSKVCSNLPTSSGSSATTSSSSSLQSLMPTTTEDSLNNELAKLSLNTRMDEEKEIDGNNHFGKQSNARSDDQIEFEIDLNQDFEPSTFLSDIFLVSTGIFF